MTLWPHWKTVRCPSGASRVALFIALAACSLHLSALREGHDWGGDFSQYILHAQNLASGKPYADLEVVSRAFNPTGPSGYPPGLPLAIAPLQWAFGLNLVAFKVPIVLSFGVVLWVFWLMLRQHLPRRWALGALSFLAFSPWMLKFSNNILSDIPYLAPLLLSLYLLDRFYSARPAFGAAASVALAVLAAALFRAVGTTLLPVAVAYAIWRHGRHLPAVLAISAAVGIALYWVYSVCSCGSSYLGTFAYNPEDLLRIIQENVAIYKRSLIRYLAIYPSRNEGSVLYVVANGAATLAFLALVGIGVASSVRRRKFGFAEAYVPCYLAIILIYPYSQKVRYLLPVLPVLCIHAFVGLRVAYLRATRLLQFLRRTPRRLVPFLPAAAYLPLFLTMWAFYAFYPPTAGANILSDPSVDQAFSHIRQNRAEISGVIFTRPRVLRLFTGVRAALCYNTPHYAWDLQNLVEFAAEHNLSHVLLGPWRTGLDTIVESHPARFRPVLSNQAFGLYAIQTSP